jgi:hypothetical protein
MTADDEFHTELAANFSTGNKSADRREEDAIVIVLLALLFFSPIIVIILLNIFYFELNLILSLIGVIVLIAGCSVLYLTFTAFKREQLITNTPTSKVRAMAMGRVELYGTALPYPDKPMKTPFGGFDCVWCGWSVSWVTSSATETESHSTEGVLPGFFYLKDDTGKVLVFTKGSEGDGKYYHEYGFSVSFLGFLQRENIQFKGPGGKFVEYYIAPHEKVYVLGTARKNPAIAGGASEKHEDDIIVAGGGEAFYISGKPYDRIHEEAGGSTTFYLILGTVLILVGLAIIFIYSGIA